MNQVIQKDTSRDAQHIILFCPITSRVGSDVQAALEKVPCKESECLQVVSLWIKLLQDGFVVYQFSKSCK